MLPNMTPLDTNNLSIWIVRSLAKFLKYGKIYNIYKRIVNLSFFMIEIQEVLEVWNPVTNTIKAKK